VLRLFDSEKDAGKNGLLHLIIEHEIELLELLTDETDSEN
jgi:hypothetical protein